jgi:hypothetical protein
MCDLGSETQVHSSIHTMHVRENIEKCNPVNAPGSMGGCVPDCGRTPMRQVMRPGGDVHVRDRRRGCAVLGSVERGGPCVPFQAVGRVHQGIDEPNRLVRGPRASERTRALQDQLSVETSRFGAVLKPRGVIAPVCTREPFYGNPGVPIAPQLCPNPGFRRVDFTSPYR